MIFWRICIQLRNYSPSDLPISFWFVWLCSKAAIWWTHMAYTYLFSYIMGECVKLSKNLWSNENFISHAYRQLVVPWILYISLHLFSTSPYQEALTINCTFSRLNKDWTWSIFGWIKNSFVLKKKKSAIHFFFFLKVVT